MLHLLNSTMLVGGGHRVASIMTDAVVRIHKNDGIVNSLGIDQSRSIPCQGTNRGSWSGQSLVDSLSTIQTRAKASGEYRMT